jgi:hypothetical protein
VHFGRNGLVQFRIFFRFWDGFLSDFAFFDAKTTGKAQDAPYKSINHAHQCVSDA